MSAANNQDLVPASPATHHQLHPLHTSACAPASDFDIDRVVTQGAGDVFTFEYRLNFYYKGLDHMLRPISPWHDIPLTRNTPTNSQTTPVTQPAHIDFQAQGQLFNFICEIPKWTRAKFECATGEKYNPIKQDTQHGQLRYYKHGDMMFNYGFFPQTWEDPAIVPEDTKCPGDNDPIDCVEIGATQIRIGGICAVKVLGLLGLIDDGETDWKVIAIAASDPMAHMMNDVDDVEKHLPGAIKAIREYFRDYKSLSGKINTYALRAQAMPRHYAIKVIEETHEHWRDLHLTKKKHVIGESTTQASGRGAEKSATATAGLSTPIAEAEAAAAALTVETGVPKPPVYVGSPQVKGLNGPSNLPTAMLPATANTSGGVDRK